MRQPYRLVHIALSIVTFMLIGCQQPDTTNTQNQSTAISSDLATQQSSSAQADSDQIIFAADVRFEPVAFDYELPQNIKDKCKVDAQQGQMPCPVIDIKLAQLNAPWMQTLLNNSITDDDSQEKLKFKRSLDDFVNESLDEDYISAVPYEYSIEPAMLTAHNNVAQFSALTSIYMGGAHGMYAMSYLLYDMDLKSQIKLGDMYANTEAAGKFYTLAEAAYDDYIVRTEREWNEAEDKTDAQIIADYKKMYEFELSEDVYFDKKGIVLSYSPYHLGSFAQGFIELTIPYDKLDGVLRAQYLPH